MEREQARGRGRGGSGQPAEQPRLLRFGTNLVPSWKKAFLCISTGQPGGLASWPSRHLPCQLLVAVCHLSRALNSTVSKVAFERPACLNRSLTWWAPASSDSSKNCPSMASPATPARPQRAPSVSEREAEKQQGVPAVQSQVWIRRAEGSINQKDPI